MFSVKGGEGRGGYVRKKRDQEYLFGVNIGDLVVSAWYDDEPQLPGSSYDGGWCIWYATSI